MLIPLATSILFSVQPYLALDDSELHWNIARDLRDTDSPNVLSELEFEGISTQLVGLQGRASREWRGSWRLLLEADGSYSRVDRGTTVDSDYFGDDRTGLYSRSRANIVGDTGVNGRGGIGLAYDLVPGRHGLAVLAGVYYQEQNLNFRRGTQEVADPSVFGSASVDDVNVLLQHLDTDYRSEWQGNYLGFAYHWTWKNWSSQWRLNYHRGRYYGEGRWNLRRDFQQPHSFSHFVTSSGYELRWQLDYQLSQHWSAFGALLRRQWDAKAGVSVTFLSNGEISATRFNEVVWRVSQTRFGLTYRW